MAYRSIINLCIFCTLSILSTAANATTWSDTSIGYRYGTQFREPVNSSDISKHIFNVTHASGYQYGTNFVNLDILLSDHKDPRTAGSNDGAQEAYIVYRHTLDLGAVSGKNFHFGMVRGLGLTAGFDANTKEDAGYNSEKRMLVLGPTVMMNVPGFLNLSVVALWESNASHNTYTNTSTPRYRYDTHPALMAAWGIPFKLGTIELSFEGYFNYIAHKGINEFGGKTKPEFNFDGRIMYDASGLIGASTHTFKVGIEYQYWYNKFGNNNQDSFYQNGAKASTPMLRTEYHF